MFTMLFAALFVEKNRKMKTKHSLVDMKLVTKRGGKHDLAHFRSYQPYLEHQRMQVRFAHLRGNDIMGITDLSDVF